MGRLITANIGIPVQLTDRINYRNEQTDLPEGSLYTYYNTWIGGIDWTLIYFTDRNIYKYNSTYGTNLTYYNLLLQCPYVDGMNGLYYDTTISPFYISKLPLLIKENWDGFSESYPHATNYIVNSSTASASHIEYSIVPTFKGKVLFNMDLVKNGSYLEDWINKYFDGTAVVPKNFYEKYNWESPTIYWDGASFQNTNTAFINRKYCILYCTITLCDHGKSSTDTGYRLYSLKTFLIGNDYTNSNPSASNIFHKTIESFKSEIINYYANHSDYSGFNVIINTKYIQYGDNVQSDRGIYNCENNYSIITDESNNPISFQNHNSHNLKFAMTIPTQSGSSQNIQTVSVTYYFGLTLKAEDLSKRIWEVIVHGKFTQYGGQTLSSFSFTWHNVATPSGVYDNGSNAPAEIKVSHSISADFYGYLEIDKVTLIENGTTVNLTFSQPYKKIQYEENQSWHGRINTINGNNTLIGINNVSHIIKFEQLWHW